MRLIQNQSCNCNASLSSFGAPSLGVRSCRNRYGRLRSNRLPNTACIRSRIRCGLDYTRLKQRLGGALNVRRKAAKAAFVELVAPDRAQLEEFVIELESLGGSKMRIQWKATTPPDWTPLLQAWRETIV